MDEDDAADIGALEEEMEPVAKRPKPSVQSKVGAFALDAGVNNEPIIPGIAPENQSDLPGLAVNDESTVPDPVLDSQPGTPDMALNNQPGIPDMILNNQPSFPDIAMNYDDDDDEGFA